MTIICFLTAEKVEFGQKIILIFNIRHFVKKKFFKYSIRLFTNDSHFVVYFKQKQSNRQQKIASKVRTFDQGMRKIFIQLVRLLTTFFYLKKKTTEPVVLTIKVGHIFLV